MPSHTVSYPYRLRKGEQQMTPISSQELAHDSGGVGVFCPRMASLVVLESKRIPKWPTKNVPTERVARPIIAVYPRMQKVRGSAQTAPVSPLAAEKITETLATPCAAAQHAAAEAIPKNPMKKRVFSLAMHLHKEEMKHIPYCG